MEKKIYDVYGIGNALVDMEFEVGEEFIRLMEIEKGLMTLVDEQRQQVLVDAVDGMRHRRTCGGSAANTIIGISQFGGKTFYSCKVGNDETGDFYFGDLKENGVATNLEFHARETGTTGKCMVFITPDAERTMNTFLGITANFSKLELAPEQLAKSQYLYIEGYLVTSPNGREAALEAKKLAAKHGVKTAMTFSDPSMPTYFREGLLEMIGDGVDVLFCNENEAHIFTQTSSTDEAFQALKKYAKSFVITQGAQGALLYDGEKEIDIVTTPVKAIDTNGAGDLFSGAFLYGITHGLSHHLSGKLACAAASKLVTQFGARLSHEQALEVKRQIVS